MMSPGQYMGVIRSSFIAEINIKKLELRYANASCEAEIDGKSLWIYTYDFTR